MILFSLSYNTVEFGEVGLKRNSISKSFDTSGVYYSGRYNTGITNNFLKYPLAWQVIEFSNTEQADNLAVSAATKSSSTVKIECFIMYRYNIDKLFDLFKAWPSVMNHKRDVIQGIKQQINVIVATYDFSDFITKRDEIQKKLSYFIGKSFQSTYFIELTYFALKRTLLEEKHLGAYLTNLLTVHKTKTTIAQGKISEIDSIIEQTTSLTNSEIEVLQQAAVITSKNTYNTLKAEGDVSYTDKVKSGMIALREELNKGTSNAVEKQAKMFVAFNYFDNIIQGKQTKNYWNLDNVGL